MIRAVMRCSTRHGEGAEGHEEDQVGERRRPSRGRRASPARRANSAQVMADRGELPALHDAEPLGHAARPAPSGRGQQRQQRQRPRAPARAAGPAASRRASARSAAPASNGCRRSSVSQTRTAAADLLAEQQPDISTRRPQHRQQRQPRGPRRQPARRRHRADRRRGRSGPLHAAVAACAPPQAAPRPASGPAGGAPPDPHRIVMPPPRGDRIGSRHGQAHRRVERPSVADQSCPRVTAAAPGRAEAGMRARQHLGDAPAPSPPAPSATSRSRPGVGAHALEGLRAWRSRAGPSPSPPAPCSGCRARSAAARRRRRHARGRAAHPAPRRSRARRAAAPGPARRASGWRRRCGTPAATPGAPRSSGITSLGEPGHRLDIRAVAHGAGEDDRRRPPSAKGEGQGRRVEAGEVHAVVDMADRAPRISGASSAKRRASSAETRMVRSNSPRRAALEGEQRARLARPDMAHRRARAVPA